MTSHSNCLALVLMFEMGGVVMNDYFVPVGLQTMVRTPARTGTCPTQRTLLWSCCDTQVLLMCKKLRSQGRSKAD